MLARVDLASHGGDCDCPPRSCAKALNAKGAKGEKQVSRRGWWLKGVGGSASVRGVAGPSTRATRFAQDDRFLLVGTRLNGG
jgi:hypothetical protein